MNLCDQCFDLLVHQVVGAGEGEYPDCDCGCHHVILLPEFDKVVWWLPAGPGMGYALRVREKPSPGLLLEYFYREPRPLGEAGPWVESDEVDLGLSQFENAERR